MRKQIHARPLVASSFCIHPSSFPCGSPSPVALAKADLSRRSPGRIRIAQLWFVGRAQHAHRCVTETVKNNWNKLPWWIQACVGAFFIVGYPGESNKTVLDTVRFASGLPLDYLSFTLPYPIPGTPLYERVKGNGVAIDDWEEPKNYYLIRHKLLYASGFSERKLKFAIGKAHAQFYGRKYLGKTGYSILGKPFERLTDVTFEAIH